MASPDLPTKVAFRVKPRIFQLLGDQLIRDANLAVFELVKNAYDADATRCSIVLTHPENSEVARILIRDDGCGMSEDILTNVWMVIATDYRTKQRQENKRTEKFKRFPLGEKGLGRWSVHKLGNVIRVITRQQGGDELILDFDWRDFEKSEYLNEATVSIQRRVPETFPRDKHGTRIEVSALRETWSRGQVRRLHRAVNSLCSPFEAPDNFRVSLSVPQNREWLKNLFGANQATACALYQIKGYIEGASAQFTYKFRPPAGITKQLSPREEDRVVSLERKEGRKSFGVDLSPYKIGKVEFEFWIFDRDPAVLRAVTQDLKGLKDYMDENGGIRIYRDGIRVYDFGEPGNDWLNLDSRRVNAVQLRTSNNQILGALRLDATTSEDLREKSNREGFIENKAYEDFRHAIISVLTNVEAEKSKDQRRVREALGRGTGQKVFAKLNELRDVLASKGVLAEVEPRLKEVEKELEIYRDQLLHAAVPGLTLGIMLHGAEKILDELRAVTQKNADPERVKMLVDNLYRAMRPVTNLLKDPGTVKTSAKAIVSEAVFSTEFRLRRHEIELIKGDASIDFPLEGSKQMLVASITNLIDNAIHWLEIKNPVPRKMYVGITKDLEGGPAIVVADNGPGFGNDNPEDLASPFFSRRAGGMGLGLYIVSEVMRVNKGQLIFPADGDVYLPNDLDGAVVGLQFPNF